MSTPKIKKSKRRLKSEFREYTPKGLKTNELKNNQDIRLMMSVTTAEALFLEDRRRHLKTQLKDVKYCEDCNVLVYEPETVHKDIPKCLCCDCDLDNCARCYDRGCQSPLCWYKKK